MSWVCHTGLCVLDVCVWEYVYGISLSQYKYAVVFEWLWLVCVCVSNVHLLTDVRVTSKIKIHRVIYSCFVYTVCFFLCQLLAYFKCIHPDQGSQYCLMMSLYCKHTTWCFSQIIDNLSLIQTGLKHLFFKKFVWRVVLHYWGWRCPLALNTWKQI